MAKIPQFQRSQGFFITGTDTGVGKTLVTGAISRVLHSLGCNVGVFKPIATGCSRRREGLVSVDAEFLAHCSCTEMSLEDITPIRYKLPLAPMVAAQREGKGIDWEYLRQAYNRASSASEILLVEGIGGIMVPLERDYLVVDLMVDLALPVIVVAKSTLGTINHTAMTVDICRGVGLNVAGIVINGYNAEEPDLAEETNPVAISDITGIPILAIIPFDTDSCVEKGMLGENVLSAIRRVDWAGLAITQDNANTPYLPECDEPY